MKILFIDTSISGHHLTYMRKLSNISELESIVLIPKKVENVSEKQYQLKYNLKSKNFISYLKFLKEVKKVVKAERPDIVHFLYGDIFYRYFGIGLRKFKRNRILVTFHQIQNSKLRNISLKKIFSLIDIGVVHTSTLKNSLLNLNINNVKAIDYPHFHNEYTSNISKERISNNIILLAIGGTRYDKGLDLLLEALKKVNRPFHLTIAGKEDFFDETYIVNNIQEYKENVSIDLRFLSDEEFGAYIQNSDCIVLPYRGMFNGASGPLGEAVWQRKPVIGPSHGSLGELIKNNRLGITFEAENSDALANSIIDFLDRKFEWNNTAEEYREKIKVSTFIDRYTDIYRDLNNKW